MGNADFKACTCFKIYIFEALEGPLKMQWWAKFEFDIQYVHRIMCIWFYYSVVVSPRHWMEQIEIKCSFKKHHFTVVKDFWPKLQTNIKQTKNNSKTKKLLTSNTHVV